MRDVIPFGDESQNCLIDRLADHDGADEVAITIEADALGGCSREMVVADYGLVVDLKIAANTVVE